MKHDSGSWQHGESARREREFRSVLTVIPPHPLFTDARKTRKRNQKHQETHREANKVKEKDEKETPECCGPATVR